MSTNHKKATDPKSFSPIYNAILPFWIDVLQLKEPLQTGLSGIAQYLIRYPKENDADFVERVKLLCQVNFLDLVVDSYLSMLFSTNIEIKSEKHQDRVDAFKNRCNQQGETLIDYFAETIAPASLAFGVTDVIVDLPQRTDEVSKYQEEQTGLNDPYIYMISPLNRINWKLDDAGNYVEYQSQDVVDTQIYPNYQQPDSQQYTCWTLDEVVIYDKNGNETDRRPNTLGFIPAVTVVPRHPLRYHKDRIGISLVQDVVPLQKQVINLMSLIMDWMVNANFVQRVLIQDTDQGDEPPTEGELAEGGNKNGIVLRGKNSDMKLVTPDAAGVEAMMRYLGETIERIYQSVSMTSDSNTNKTHQTGQTIRSNNAVLFNKLSKITKHFERAIKQIVEMALRVQGIKEDCGVTVQWDRNFAYEAFITAIQELQMLKQTASDISPTAIAEYAKAVIAPKLYSSGKMADVDREADEWAKKVNANPDLLTPQKPQTLEQSNQSINAADKVAQDE